MISAIGSDVATWHLLRHGTRWTAEHTVPGWSHVGSQLPGALRKHSTSASERSRTTSYDAKRTGWVRRRPRHCDAERRSAGRSSEAGVTFPHAGPGESALAQSCSVATTTGHASPGRAHSEARYTGISSV